MIPQETVNLILETARIEDVVGDFVTLKRRGASFVACCPFHNEKTPSFHVTPSRGIYKCFGCGKGGSAVGFVMEYEHCGYVDALRYLARKYHIEIVEKEESAEDLMQKQHRESLMLVTEFAQKFFVKNLQEGEGRAVGLAYFHSRGLSAETIARFGLGWAPSNRNALASAALAAGYREEYLIEAGLCTKYDDGRLMDRFHDRVTFPVHAVSGRVIAFSCRLLHEVPNAGKYVNSPETEIYVKSRALFGIYLAKGEISRLDKCYLVEGNVDVVSMHQLGITNLVASCGTALTVEQVRMIKRFTQNVTIMYDGDKAGIKAALKGLRLVLAEGMNVKVVLLPDGKDPDDFARTHTLEEVQTYIAQNERDFITFKAAMALKDAGDDPLKRAELINEIADDIALMPDPVKRSVYVEECSNRFGIESRILFDRMNGTRKRARDEEFKAEERARRREQAGLPPLEGQEPPAPAEGPYPFPPLPGETAPAPQGPAPLTLSSLEQNHILGQAERDLLHFLLKYGTDEIDFESDSDYYSGSEEDKPTVADFIISSFEADKSTFANEAYRNVYEAYVSDYGEGYDQDTIVKHLLDSSDRTMAFVTMELATDKHILTVKNFEDSLTARGSWLAEFVPKALLFYADRRLEDRIARLKNQLAAATDTDAQIMIMTDMKKLQAAQKTVRIKLGRDRKDTI